jgi:hypothetical protein
MRAWLERDRTGERGVICARRGGAGDGVVDGERYGGVAGARNGEETVHRALFIGGGRGGGDADERGRNAKDEGTIGPEIATVARLWKMRNHSVAVLMT